MKLDSALYRNGAFLFAIFAAAIVWGFWPNYYAHPWKMPATRFHIHGILMSSWLLMLLAQAYLIRTDRRAVHRRVGKASYVLAPVLVIVLVVMIHANVGRDPASAILPLFLFYVLGATVLFGVFYLLAMLNRHTPAVHARYMACTLFPIYSAGTDRIIGRGFPDNPLFITWAWFAGDLILLTLAIWDWRSHRRFGPFAVAFTTMVVYHGLIFLAPSIPGWPAFANWFANL